MTSPDPDSGSVQNGSTVTLSDSTPGATIYYTTDGSTPTIASASGTSVTIAGIPGGTETVKAMAVVPGYKDSNIATFTYTILLVVH